MRVMHVIEVNRVSKIKRINVNPGRRLLTRRTSAGLSTGSSFSASRQFTNDHEIILACQEMSVGVLVGAKCRLANQAAEELVVEAQHGRYTGGDDIVRTEDD